MRGKAEKRYVRRRRESAVVLLLCGGAEKSKLTRGGENGQIFARAVLRRFGKRAKKHYLCEEKREDMHSVLILSFALLTINNLRSTKMYI